MLDDDLTSFDRNHVWHAFTQMQEYEPLLIERGEGCWLVDTEGRRYLDGSASMWCNVHGHRHPRLDAALAAQAAKVSHPTNLGLTTSTTVACARRLVEIAPPGLEKVFFSADGSSAIEAALKMAFQYWLQADPPRPSRTRFIAIGEAYHGDTLGAIGVGGVDRFTAMFAPLTFEAIRLPSPGGPCPHGGRPAPSLDESLAALDRLLDAHGGTVAALVMEPLVQMAAGIYVHPPGFLRGVRELTARHDVLLILDEVATGFGRTGTLFALEQCGVQADILCIGKGLTGGYLAMSATVANQRVYEAFLGEDLSERTMYHGHSYSGNALAAAVALRHLELIDERHILENVMARAEQLEGLLAQEISPKPAVAAVRQRGLMVGIELRPPADGLRWGRRVSAACVEAGVLIRPLGDVVVLMPMLSSTPEEIERIVATVARAIDDVCGT